MKTLDLIKEYPAVLPAAEKYRLYSSKCLK